MRLQIQGQSLLVASLLLVAVACGGGDDNGTADGGGERLGDLPFPTVEQFQSAEACDELNRLLAGVENESFRVNADRTLAEEESKAEDEFENTFDPFYGAFSERQADLECSDAQMMSVLQTASDQRCETWIDSGHTLDEDPLLMNTAHCIDESG